MEKKEKDGLIAFDYKSESAKATYDKIIVKADVITDGDKAKGIFKFLYNGEELPQERREFNTIINRHGDIYGQIYALGRQRLGFEDHIVDEEGQTLNVKPEAVLR